MGSQGSGRRGASDRGTLESCRRGVCDRGRLTLERFMLRFLQCQMLTGHAGRAPQGGGGFSGPLGHTCHASLDALFALPFSHLKRGPMISRHRGNIRKSCDSVGWVLAVPGSWLWVSF